MKYFKNLLHKFLYKFSLPDFYNYFFSWETVICSIKFSTSISVLLKNYNNPCVNNRNFSFFLPNSIFSFPNLKEVQAHYLSCKGRFFWYNNITLEWNLKKNGVIILMSDENNYFSLSLYYLHNCIQQHWVIPRNKVI